jgi:hypothetical protein
VSCLGLTSANSPSLSVAPRVDWLPARLPTIRLLNLDPRRISPLVCSKEHEPVASAIVRLNQDTRTLVSRLVSKEQAH